MTERSCYLILHPYINRDEYDCICTATADVEIIPTDTLEGVYANMLKRGWSARDVEVIHGTRVKLDMSRFVKETG